MSAEIKKEIQLEIAHVLFIDIVGYSKFSINEQGAVVDELTKVVRSSDQYQKAEATGRLIKIPTGDGMGLVFHTSPEAPAQCAVEISRVLKEHPRLQLRMGVHSGPVSGVIDVNERANIAGAGVNVAKRVMDCGDAGHILLSKHVAEDLEEYEQWRPLLHDLGVCEVKHGVRVAIVNLYADKVGNPQLPKKFQALKKHSARVRWAAMTAALLVLAVIVAGIAIFSRYRARSPLAAPEKSIAVLPFENLSANQENAFFTVGVQGEILANLAKVADLKVISHTSVMLYKSGSPRNLREIGQQLGVAHVLEGSVQRAVNRVRVTAQLVDARTDAHLWAQTYDRDLADVFAIQSEIAQKIADQLQAKLSPKEKSAITKRPTSDLVAYDLYLQAKELLYGQNINPIRRQEQDAFKAVQLLDQAVARDPAFLLAHCQLAYAHDLIYWFTFDHTKTRLGLAETSVRAAVRLQPDSGETHLAQAIHFYWGYLNYDWAREELEKAESALPNNAEIFQFLGLIDRRQGRWEEAIRNLERAVNLDPRNIVSITHLGYVYEGLRNYGEAIAMANRALALEPRSINLRTNPAWIGVDAQADIAPLRAVVNTIEAEGPSSAADVSETSFELALRERDPAAAARALANIPSEGYIGGIFQFPHAWYEGLLAKLRQDAPAAHSAFTVARAGAEKISRDQPRSADRLSVLALIDAELGNKEKAIQEGRTACDMLPPTKDAVLGVPLITNLARIYARIGEENLALERLDIVSKLPGGPSYGQLRLDPEWDSLRGDPRFEKIVASLAPKKASP
ncbi:MAG: tetratricopeptide repeat protein [Verrucomicrobia bacterium]|nr:MAG: tetratricopeptide repeat protein [Verrucomicrobiota bacterium]